MRGRPSSIGLKLVLIAVLIAFACVVLLHTPQHCFDNAACQTIVEEFLDLDLNEKGDALAGIFSSFAFLAAVGALLFQRKELTEQREATQDMAKSMEAQVDLMEEQTKFYQEERMRRKEDAARNELYALIKRFQGRFPVGENYAPISWKLAGQSDQIKLNYKKNDDDPKSWELVDFMYRCGAAMDQRCFKKLKGLRQRSKESFVLEKSSGRDLFLELRELVIEMEGRREKLSKHDLIFFERCRLDVWRAGFEELKKDEYWVKDKGSL